MARALIARSASVHQMLVAETTQAVLVNQQILVDQQIAFVGLSGFTLEIE